MKRPTVLKIVNVVIAVLALSQVLTGALHDVIPEYVFNSVHRKGGYVFAFTALAHVFLNWNWIKANYLSGKPPAADRPSAPEKTQGERS